MNIWVRLVTITVVVAAVAGTGGYLVWVYFPPAPYAHIALFPERSEYTPGDVATFVVANRGALRFSVLVWFVERLLNDEWILAECHDTAAVAVTIGPFGHYVFQWTVTMPGSPEEECGFFLPPLEPGPFRGTVVLASPDRNVEPAQFFAEFHVV